ncbi:inositol polyphosphate kinase-like protein [Trypanosoma rangeli]|uniref:Kinase n=1 Tax=Trypanosoma rangeli TaxID=5698 RepID=A0A422NX74_TRYRA|nr:inositol polyphosphate kinase-like protein [Trypanosoma rangeli]RNF10078.1 inositol polyphosphate kinase-like protein [Trypanosoma rangeli]|eukprot:RNF10078.1 inositol polyphosphate kinase-like protein [Trypanosoma rangeli]
MRRETEESSFQQRSLEGDGDAAAGVLPLLSKTPDVGPIPESPTFVLPKLSRRNHFAAASDDEEDDGYKSSDEATLRDDHTGGVVNVSLSCSSVINTVFAEPLQRGASGANHDDGGGGEARPPQSENSTCVDARKRWSGSLRATHLLGDDDDYYDYVSAEAATRGRINAVRTDTDSVTTTTAFARDETISAGETQRHPEHGPEDSSTKELSSSREGLVGSGLCADLHPLPKYNSDGFVEPSGRSPQKQQQFKKIRKNWARLFQPEASGREAGGGGEVRRRRVVNARPTTASGVLGAGGTGATTVRVDNVLEPVINIAGSVGGHHLAIVEGGVFMKESCSKREERFYEMLKPVQEYVWRHRELLDAYYYSTSSSSSASASTSTSTSSASSASSASDGSSEVAEVGGGDQRGDSGEGDGSQSLEQKASVPVHWDMWWWCRRRGSLSTARSGRGMRAGGGGVSGAFGIGGEGPRGTNTAAAVRGGRHWDVLVPLVPFTPRYLGRRCVWLEGDPCRSKGGEPAFPPATEQGEGKFATSQAEATATATSTAMASENEKKLRQMIVLEDLCNGFVRPCILDIKMGSRQYGMNPPEAKLHSKVRKAALSTSMQHGVRLAGMKQWCPDTQQYETQSKMAGRKMTLEELRETILRFMQYSKRLRHNFCKQLRRLRLAFMQQDVFRFFTSSLLFVYDADRPLLSSRIVMVDFAFTYEREELQRGGDPEAAYERDDGYIKALDTLLDILA